MFASVATNEYKKFPYLTDVKRFNEIIKCLGRVRWESHVQEQPEKLNDLVRPCFKIKMNK